MSVRAAQLRRRARRWILLIGGIALFFGGGLVPPGWADAPPAVRPEAEEDDRRSGPLLFGTLAGAEILERSGLRFVFVPADRLAAQELARVGTQARAAIAADLGRDPGGVFEVVLAHDQAAFRQLLGDAPDWMAGVAYGPRRWTAIRLDPRGEAPWREVEQTFRHELSHLMLYAATGGAGDVPRWFSEGLAIYQSGEWSFEQARTITQGILQGRLFRLDELTHTFPQRTDRVHLAYAQSVAFTSYLLRQGQAGEFSRLLQLVASGTPFGEAIAKAFGRSLDELEAEWQSQLERNYAWVPLVLGGSTLWALVSLLFLLAYAVRQHRGRQKLKRWEREERLWDELYRPEPDPDRQPLLDRSQLN